MPSRAGPEDIGERQALPLYPLDSLTPFLTRAAALDPGLGGGRYFDHRNEDAKRPRRRYRSRLKVRGVSEMGYFCRKDVRSEHPGLRRRCARPRPSGRVEREDSLLAQPQHCVLQGCASSGRDCFV